MRASGSNVSYAPWRIANYQLRDDTGMRAVTEGTGIGLDEIVMMTTIGTAATTARETSVMKRGRGDTRIGFHEIVQA